MEGSEFVCWVRWCGGSCGISAGCYGVMGGGVWVVVAVVVVG